MGESSVIDPQLALSHKYPESTWTYTERDVALYALGIGACGNDAVDTDELKYVYHLDGQQHIQVFPTFAATFCYSSVSVPYGIKCPGLEFDERLLLHGQQYIELYRPLPASASVRAIALRFFNKNAEFDLKEKTFEKSLVELSSNTIRHEVTLAGLHDKGKAAIVEVETKSFDQASGELLCMNRSTSFLRGAGGFSKTTQPYSYANYPAKQVSNVTIPREPPSSTFEDRTQPSQALLYRLSGDYNPLHSDPMIAKVAGFSQPILHGLCTLGHAVRAVIKRICKGDPNTVKSIFGRFLLHVYPGETLITEMWLQGSRVIYQTKVKERNRAVLLGYVDLHRLSSSL